MEKSNQLYSVKKLSELAGVTIRTLHHYDKIGLLSPNFRSEKGYRQYCREDLLKLQQILFYKFLGYDLKSIYSILNSPSFDLLKSLKEHKKTLEKRSQDLSTLIATIDKTINELIKEEGMISEQEIYEGFGKEAESIREEVRERWPDELEAVEARIKEFSKKEWADVKQESEEISLWLGNLVHKREDSLEVQKVVQLHFNHISRFYEVTKARYEGLAHMYLQDERFKQHYDEVKPGLAQFLSKAMLIYSAEQLS